MAGSERANALNIGAFNQRTVSTLEGHYEKSRNQ
jgi:hypothetical protein